MSFSNNESQQHKSEESLAPTPLSTHRPGSAAQALIENVIENIADPFYALDHDWRFVYVNRRAVEMWGKSREELIGQNIWELFPNGVQTQAYQEMQRAVKDRTPGAFETFSRFLNAWVEIHLYPSSIGLAVYFRNIDRRKQLELALLRNADRNAFRLTLADTLRPLHDPLAIQLEAAMVLGRYLGANRVLYAEVSENGEQLSIYQDYIYGVESVRGTYNLKDYAQSLVDEYRAGHTVVIKDAINETRLEYADRMQLIHINIGALVSVPLVKNGECVALFAVHYKEPHDWQPHEIELIEEVAERTWASVERATTELLLRQTEERFQVAQNAGNVGVWDWNAITGKIYWSDVTWRLYNLEPFAQEIHNGVWLSRVHPLDKERAQAKVQQLFKSDGVDYRDEFRIIHPNGAVRWIESIAQVTRDETGKPVRMFGVNYDITERKRIEDSLREAEERLRLIINSAKDYAIFALDVEGRIATWNAGAERVFGYAETEIIGQPGQIIYTPEDRAAQVLEKEMARAVETGAAENERWHVRKDGSRFFASGMVRPIHDETGILRGFTKVARNTTDRHLAQQRTQILQQVTSKLSPLLTFEEAAKVVVDEAVIALGALTGAINLLEDEHTFVVIYTFASRLSEADRAQWTRFPVDLPLPASVALKTKQILWFKNSEALVEQFPMLETLGAQYPGTWIFLPLLIEDRAIGILGFTFAGEHHFDRDELDFMMALAHQCSQAMERARLYQAELEAREAAENANRLKMKFLGMISHELRTPLTSIKGFTTTLLAEDVTFPPEQQREFLQIMDQEANRLTDLVEQLLDLSRLQAGTFRINPSAQPFSTIINIARTQLETLTAFHPLTITLPDDLPPLLVDTQRIAQVLVNLVANAVKFSPLSTPVTIHAAQKEGEVQIDIADQGMGIPPEDRDSVFEAFRQVERKKPNPHQGAGLGLAICKGIVEAHGGRIWVQDQPVGTVISFVLPVVDYPTKVQRIAAID